MIKKFFLMLKRMGKKGQQGNSSGINEGLLELWVKSLHKALQGRVSINKLKEEIKKEHKLYEPLHLAADRVYQRMYSQLDTMPESSQKKESWAKRYAKKGWGAAKEYAGKGSEYAGRGWEGAKGYAGKGWDYTKEGAKYAGKGLWWGGVKAPWWMMKTAGKAVKQGLTSERDKGTFWAAAFYVFLAWLVFQFDKWINFDGIDIGIVLSRFSDNALIFRIFFNIFVVVALIWYFIVRSPSKRDFISYAIFIFLTSVIISFGALSSGLYHFIIVYSLYFFFIPKASEVLGWDAATQRYVMCILLFIDYFGFGIMKYIGFEQLGNRYVIPLWSFVILVLKQKYSPHWFSTGALIGLIVWVVVPFTYDVLVTDAGKLATRQQFEAAADMSRQRAEALANQMVNAFTGAKKQYVKQLEYATGGYYEGQVEENENVPLGVYFKDVRASVLEFNEDEPVEVWGTLLVRTLDREKPVTISVGCEYADGGVDGDAIPREPFTVYTLEEEAFECKFKRGAIPRGTRGIRLNANFNFETMAYLKSYMIDKETLRAFRRDNVDIFKHYGIKDKKPIAIFTNGPLKIGMETNEPPIGIDENSMPYLGITIENQWSGNVESITNMIVQIPRSIVFFDNCDKKFDLADSSADPDYNTYVLNDKGKRYLKLPIKINEEDSRSLRCLMKVQNKNELLGAVPFTTKYFRATASYDYELMQEVNVNVKQVTRAEYLITGGACDKGNDFSFILSNIGRTNLANCKQYLDVFNEGHKLMDNKDSIDLLMVLAVAQRESNCIASDSGGIMQVDENGKRKDYSKAEDKVVIQIGDGVAIFDKAYDSAKQKNSESGYGFDNINLLKFALLGYNRGSGVTSKAMEYAYGSMGIYDAMLEGCRQYFQNQKDDDGYDKCDGTQDGKDDKRNYGAVYPGAVFGAYRDACQTMGGMYNEETIA